MAKNSPINAGDRALIPDPGRSHALHTTAEPVLWSLGAAVTEVSEPQDPWFTARGGTAMRSQHTTARG